MNEITWKFTCNNFTMNRLMEFFDAAAKYNSASIQPIDCNVNTLKKECTAKDVKYISTWVKCNYDMLRVNSTLLKGVKYNIRGQEPLYFLGFGDNHKWDVFGRWVWNNKTKEYIAILLSGLSVISKENLIVVSDISLDNIIDSIHNYDDILKNIFQRT